ncbi:anthranilate synthase component I family protein [Flavihumibacter rivuli]|uniref:anthranilate synthase component I family protein n=1 Tax=Flavihumibacter rivuli TaxID=2838156 RepID=UPI001EFA4248|nr:anthranilate synthase component I family protein [Flavihumibacter rivuli]ULQ56444.1 anthranilate synthase component I family protein [Flavihumibacter rivuli]
MDNNGYDGSHHSYECLIAAGAWRQLKLPSGKAFDLLNAFSRQQRDWLFGHFGYELRTETEQLERKLPDPIGFPDLHFFVPEHLLLVGNDQVLISSHSTDPRQLFQQVLSMPATAREPRVPAQLMPRLTKMEYLERVNAIKAHIHRGDCYEVNFCQEFYAGDVKLDAAAVFQELCEVSPNPFAVYYKTDDRYLLCASPERYLRIQDGVIWSQPIKGTAPRDSQDPVHDQQLARSLQESVKERSENVMVVDLVRNDLSRICKEGTVTVEELFGVYSYPQVHQMISTVKGELSEGQNWVDAVRATFPMGSMTGAPKKKVMEIIEHYETTGRGIFSGAVGYVDPRGNADFNVVIRSLMYNSLNGYLSYQVGSGITWYADPEKEYEECLLKAAAIKKVLAH